MSSEVGSWTRAQTGVPNSASSCPRTHGISPGRVRASLRVHAFTGSGLARRLGALRVREAVRVAAIAPMMARMPDALPPAVTLVPLGTDAWEAWRERSVREYAAAKAR